eukprot:gene5980-9979_t
MGNVFAIGSDLTVDVASSVLQKSQSKKDPLHQFQDQLCELEKKSKLFVEETKARGYISKPFSPFSYEIESSTITVKNIVTGENFRIHFEQKEIELTSEITIKFYPNANIIYLFQDKKIFIFKLEESFMNKEEKNSKFTGLKQTAIPLDNIKLFHFLFFRIDGKLAVSDKTGLYLYDEKTGDSFHKNHDFIGNLNQTLNREYLYEVCNHWYDLNQPGDFQQKKKMTDFHSISNNGKYLLTVDHEKYIFKVYPTSILRESPNEQVDNFICEFSVFNEIKKTEFSYDSNYVILTCRISSEGNIFANDLVFYELYVYSIEEKKFVIYISYLLEDSFSTFENYLYLGNYINQHHMTLNRYLTFRLPAHKINSIQGDQGSDLNFKFF